MRKLLRCLLIWLGASIPRLHYASFLTLKHGAKLDRWEEKKKISPSATLFPEVKMAFQLKANCPFTNRWIYMYGQEVNKFEQVCSGHTRIPPSPNNRQTGRHDWIHQQLRLREVKIAIPCRNACCTHRCWASVQIKNFLYPEFCNHTTPAEKGTQRQ